MASTLPPGFGGGNADAVAGTRAAGAAPCHSVSSCYHRGIRPAREVPPRPEERSPDGHQGNPDDPGGAGRHVRRGPRGRRAREAAVLFLWEGEAFSTRAAAEKLGLAYSEFLDLLAARGPPVERGPLAANAIEAAATQLAGKPA
ncbi:MAG TPA: hypothetical protein VK689_12010 [Armatimonadota bacterium]|nr:hypothetical protein [Armatimonadota bacterium]